MGLSLLLKDRRTTTRIAKEGLSPENCVIARVSLIIPNLSSFSQTIPSHRIHAAESADQILLFHGNTLVRFGSGAAQAQRVSQRFKNSGRKDNTLADIASKSSSR